jgi:hypothetical protein
MHMRGTTNWRQMAGLVVMLLALTGCNGRLRSGPQLVDEVTYIPTVAVLPSITSTPTVTATPTLAPPTRDLAAETALALVTPTLPPSRTPSMTWTPSNTPTSTPTPTMTLPPTLTPLPTPVPVAVQPTQPPFSTGGQPVSGNPASSISAPPGAVDGGGNCLYPWYFTAQPISGCPVGPVAISPSAFLDFTGGWMFWIGSERMIYVVYNDGNFPRWERYADAWVEGMPERDPSIVGPAGLWQQPRRGFGYLWRNNVAVRGRMSWALHEWETAYDAAIQQVGAEGGGAIFVSAPSGEVFELAANQTSWTQH